MEKRPNIIVFMADDLGFGDLSCAGSEFCKTPNLDALAAQGVRFTNWYSCAPICSASRASLLTGRYPAKVGVPGNVSPLPGTVGLTPGVPTLADALKELGYRTAMFGKWHLGNWSPCRPEDRGFDEWFGFLNGCIDYYSHIFYWGMASGKMDQVHDLWENGEEIYQNGRYFVDLMTERTLGYLKRTASDDRPFFLYVPYNAPHYPMHAPEEYMKRFEHLPWEKQVYAAMVSVMDDSIGMIVDELKAQGRFENTCIFFQPDHGPSRETRNWLDGNTAPYPGGSTGGLKGHKASLFDGGIHLPSLICWPNAIPGGRVSDSFGTGLDVFATLLAAAGGDPTSYETDGFDLMPMIVNGEPSPRREMFWKFANQRAVRRDNWKLVLNGRLVDEGAPDPIHLSDLGSDPGERTNLKDEHPDVVQELTAAIEAWEQTVETTDAARA